MLETTRASRPCSAMEDRRTPSWQKRAWTHADDSFNPKMKPLQDRDPQSRRATSASAKKRRPRTQIRSRGEQHRPQRPGGERAQRHYRSLGAQYNRPQRNGRTKREMIGLTTQRQKWTDQPPLLETPSKQRTKFPQSRNHDHPAPTMVSGRSATWACIAATGAIALLPRR